MALDFEKMKAKRDALEIAEDQASFGALKMVNR